MKKTGFTLIELLIVVIIIGMLSVLAYSQFEGYKESQLDREAQANIRVIADAERALRIASDNDSYVAYTGAQPAALNNLNAGLKLMVPVANTRNWNYWVQVRPAAPAQGTRFCVEAQRVVNGVAINRWWSMMQDEAAPVQNNQSCNRRAW